MSIATIFLPVETPLGDYTLAGQRGLAFLQDAAGRLNSRFSEAGELDQGLRSQLRTWLDGNIHQILLIQDDRPLLTTEALDRLVQHQADGAAPLVGLSALGEDFAAGCADARWLWEQTKSAASPLTLNHLVRTAKAPILSPTDPADCLAVNSLPALAEAERLLRQRINQAWMEAGVQMIDPATTYIHAAVTIGQGTIILPNTHLWGQTTIGEASRIGPNSIVRDSEIGNRCCITTSVVEYAVMEDESDIGPFGHLRKGARVCRGAHVGNFGEIKNSTLGPNAKMGHFSYLGDTIVGEEANIGAGAVTCNYDGANKHQTIIQDNAFIGSGAMLVAPVEIGAGARIGAGSVVTRNVPAGAVVYGVPARIKQSVEEKEEQEGDDSEPK
jgi:bifunctional N-acetylglucosamine-1-phosphate-uridyltransferase/glucosamine-1-phosphate-acetyltransferase GlmU-like protein